MLCWILNTAVALITHLQGQITEISNFTEHRTMFKGQSSRAHDFKCFFWSIKEKITAFHIHILYCEWLQTNPRESLEYWLVCAWELTLEYVISRVCQLVKPLLTPPWLWWNLNCLFPLSLPLWEAWQGIIPCLLMMDDLTGSAQRCLLGTWQRWAGSKAWAVLQTSWPAGTPTPYHRQQQQPPFISSHPWGFNIMVEGKCLLVLHWPHSLMLLLWALWTRAGEVVWGGGRHCGKGGASCFGWCDHHRLLHWKES